MLSEKMMKDEYKDGKKEGKFLGKLEAISIVFENFVSYPDIIT